MLFFPIVQATSRGDDISDLHGVIKYALPHLSNVAGDCCAGRLRNGT